MKLSRVLQTEYDQIEDFGYTWDFSYSRDHDKQLVDAIRRDRGETYVNDMFDDACELNNCYLCEDEDDPGALYAVLFIYHDHEMVPAVWHRVKKIEKEA